MFDSSFFALLFLIASALAPAGAREIGWQNVRHPEQSMLWTRREDGWFAMRVNQREMGAFRRVGERVESQGFGPAQAFSISELVDPMQLRAEATRLALRGGNRATTLVVERERGELRLVDPAGQLLGAPLRLRSP